MDGELASEMYPEEDFLSFCSCNLLENTSPGHAFFAGEVICRPSQHPRPRQYEPILLIGTRLAL